MKKAKLDAILNLDYRLEESQERIQQILYKIKPLTKYENYGSKVPLEQLEKVMSILCRKYGFMAKIELLCMPDNVDIYKASIQQLEEYQELGRVYGCCLYELCAKATILMYDKSRKVEKRA